MKYCIHNGMLFNGFLQYEGKSAILLDGDTIKDIFSEKRFNEKKFDADVKIIDAQGNFILPGLIDTHIHGFKGNGTDNCTTEGILQMSKDLAQYGVTSFNPTMYPAPLEEMCKKIESIVKAIGKEEGAKIQGIHLEGPFISPHKLGVQKPETLMKPDIKAMEKLWNASQGHIKNMTVAPELEGMRELALYCLEKGIVLQAGHTNADYGHMVEGIQAGILHSTHFFNAMSQLHHRNPGAVGAILTHPEISCEIIADGIHVHPDLFKLLSKDKSTDQIVLITDALTPTEQNSNILYANGEEVIAHDGCFHRKIDDVIAGSSLTMIQAVRNMISFGYPISDAIKCATSNPARIMKYTNTGTLAPLYKSDLLICTPNLEIQTVMINGKIVKGEL